MCDAIPQDIWVNIFSFLPVNQLLAPASTCREFNSTIFSTETECSNQLWKMYCIQQLHNGTNNETQDDVNEDILDYTKYYNEDNIVLKSYLELFKSRLVSFDISTVNTELTRLEFSNGNRTVHNMRSESEEKWDALRLNKKLVAGRKYTFKFRIDKYVQRENVWVICIGINELDMVYRRENSSEFGTYGCCKSYGLTLIAFDGTIYNGRNQSIPPIYNEEFVQKSPLFSDGDIVTMIVDMTNASIEHDSTIQEIDINHGISPPFRHRLREKGTSVEYLINGKPLMKHPYYGVAGQEFYATVTLVNQQKVTVLSH
jgi:hypothetical protein